MLEGKRTLVSVLLGVGLLLGLISMVLPWWTVEGAVGEFAAGMDAKPFDTGDLGDQVSTMGVMSVGVLTVFGVVAAAGGGALWLSLSSKGETVTPPAWWLMIAGGILFVMAPIVAAATWPSDDLGFWVSIGADRFGLSAAANVGWYMALLAGALMATAGIVGLQPPMEERDDVVDDPPDPEDVGVVAEQTEEVQPPGVA